MTYKMENGRKVNIPDDDLNEMMKNLELSKEEAIDLWLTDNDFETDEEQDELDKKAKKVRVQHDAVGAEPRKKSDKPRTVKVSDAKKELFNQFSQFLTDFCEKNAASYSILTENKLFQVKFGGETFKIDLVQQRKPKK